MFAVLAAAAEYELELHAGHDIGPGGTQPPAGP